jgi:beta-galactosidase
MRLISICLLPNQTMDGRHFGNECLSPCSSRLCGLSKLIKFSRASVKAITLAVPYTCFNHRGAMSTEKKKASPGHVPFWDLPFAMFLAAAAFGEHLSFYRRTPISIFCRPFGTCAHLPGLPRLESLGYFRKVPPGLPKTEMLTRVRFTIVNAGFSFLLLASLAVSATALPRERVSLNEDWRFIKGEPSEFTSNLQYDVRPQQRRGDGGTNTTAGQATNAMPVLKPWVLPTGNAFIKDPSRRFVRPAGNPGEGVAYVRSDFDDSHWQRLDLPHDWAITGPFTTTGGGGMGRLPSAGIGWYRKKLKLPAEDAGKSLFLDVDGAMSYAAVWVNEQFVGGWPCGYASWRLDVTAYLKTGAENQLAIRLDNPPNSSRWYPGGGIYRNVWLVKTAPIHVAQWGTQLTTPEVSPASAKVNLKVMVDNDSKVAAEVSVSTDIYALDPVGGRTGTTVATIAPVNVSVTPGSSAVVEGSGTVRSPKLWGPLPYQRPNRYVAVSSIWEKGTVVDTYETAFGIRSLKFDPNEGFFINGERVPLNGVCNHHDLGALGAALNYRALERQLEMMAEMGCNSLRTSHNPPAPELLELADRMGFLVMDEAFDVWVRQKTPLDFHLIFPDWHEQDFRAQIRRDRNCPSVIMWSIGNEVGEQYTGADGAAWGKKLTEIAHDEDPTRPTTTAMNSAQATNLLPATVDIIGLNYQGAGVRKAPGQYPAFHEKFPQKLIIGSETASALSSRGEYIFPITNANSAPVSASSGEDRARKQVSAYELYAAAFGASADKVFASQEKHPYVGGEFVWIGWDYLGEPTPFDSSRSSYSGIIDLAGFKKDRFYLYQAHWRPDFPMVHILPHWTWPERVGQMTPVHVFTSGDEGELFLNGKLLGRRKKGEFEYRLRWDEVVYEPGTLKVVTYKSGKLWATAEMKTAGTAASLRVEPDRNRIRADGRDLSFVTVTITDKSGVTVPRADNRVQFEIEGPGEIVATDNGDPTSFEPFQSHSRKAFNGLCLVIVRGKAGALGKIRLTAKADGLKNGKTTIETTRSP